MNARRAYGIGASIAVASGLAASACHPRSGDAASDAGSAAIGAGATRADRRPNYDGWNSFFPLPANGEKWFPAGVLKETGNYEPNLRALGESSFYAPFDHPRYRLLIERTFAAPIAIRVEELHPGASSLFVECGESLVDAGMRRRHRERRLNENEARTFAEQLAAARARDMDPENDDRGPDGGMWLFEEVVRDGYWAVERWSPDSRGKSVQPGTERFGRFGAYLQQLGDVAVMCQDDNPRL